MSDLRCQRIIKRTSPSGESAELQSCGAVARFELVDWTGKRIAVFCNRHYPAGVPGDLVKFLAILAIGATA